MGYETILRFTLVPTIFLFVLQLISIILITHYWILGDWVSLRYITRTSNNAEVIDMIDYAQAPTDAAIVSAALGIFAGVVALIAFFKLRKRDMDDDINIPRRRFYVAFAVFSALMCFIAAISTLAYHYTKQGDGQDGCKVIPQSSGDRVLECTREVASCNVLPRWQKLRPTTQSWAIPLACNEAQAVKWLQLIIMFNELTVIGMFLGQAFLRKRTRYERIEFGKEGIDLK